MRWCESTVKTRLHRLPSDVERTADRAFPRSMVAKIILAVAVFFLGLACAAPSSRATAPERPRHYVDTSLVAPSGRTTVVSDHGGLQAALDAAQPGDVITLPAGAIYTGPFTLPKKPGAGWIIVRSAAPPGALPPPGHRIDPSYAPVRPKILVASGGSAIQTAAGAHHFRFIGIEIAPLP